MTVGKVAASWSVSWRNIAIALKIPFSRRTDGASLRERLLSTMVADALLPLRARPSRAALHMSRDKVGRVTYWRMP